jgi:hypothetical protein
MAVASTRDIQTARGTDTRPSATEAIEDVGNERLSIGRMKRSRTASRPWEDPVGATNLPHEGEAAVDGLKHQTDTKPRVDVHAVQDRLVIRLVFSVCRPLIPPPIVRVPERGTIVGREVSQGLRLDDPRVSRHHATFYSVGGRISILDQASKNGTFVNGVRVERHDLVEGDVLSLGDSCFVVAQEPDEEEGPVVPGLLGDSAAMRRARAAVRKLGPTDLTVLLTAETGCGKEVVARALHGASGLKGAFVPINCAAIPENLFESELFGHTAKAFTGAVGHTGFVREALGGTLLLDEVGELPLSLQPKLLRVLEERAVVPLGATRPIPCPVRVVANGVRTYSCCLRTRWAPATSS